VGESARVAALDGTALPMDAPIPAIDESADVAVLRSCRPFRKLTTTVALADTAPSFAQVIIIGVADIYDVRTYD
jgi:hypothetical protein